MAKVIHFPERTQPPESTDSVTRMLMIGQLWPEAEGTVYTCVTWHERYGYRYRLRDQTGQVKYMYLRDTPTELLQDPAIQSAMSLDSKLRIAVENTLRSRRK